MKTYVAALSLVVVTAFACSGQELLPAPPEERANRSQPPTLAQNWLPQTQTNYVAPYSGYVNHAHVSPTFRWGWFGAEHFYPDVQWHQNYVGDRIRWSNQRRY